MVQAGASLNKRFFLFSCVLLLAACTNKTPEPLPEKNSETIPKIVRAQAPEFNADSAFQYVKTQVDFGPRVPNTKAHEQCAVYLEKKLKSVGLTVTVQEGNVVNYAGKTFRIKNIMGSFHPENTSRIVLFSHWDSRHIADMDTIRKNEPIDGANDGASGVGVLIEIARQLQKVSPEIGVDVMFLDAEDTGEPNDLPRDQHKEDSWCLGTQYWTKNMPRNYSPRFGILLDMVGAHDPTFPMEGGSLQYADDVVKKVWGLASDLGYSNMFIYMECPTLTDDHAYINRDAKIPTIDIVDYNPKTHDFGSYHHTHADNIKLIDRNTLKAVGQVLLQVIYDEQK
jgi:glutaminyl-peptide cyclotransferase